MELRIKEAVRSKLGRTLSIVGALGLAFAVSGILAGPGAAQEAKGPKFNGHKKCKACHMKIFKSWEATKHAKAMENLKPGVAKEAKEKAKLDPAKDYTTDEACLKCHATGVGRGGFDPKGSGADQAKFGAVGCEACHGPGAEYAIAMKDDKYKKADLLAKGLVTPEEKVCVSCHNQESPTYQPFEFAKAKAVAGAIHEHVPLKHPH